MTDIDQILLSMVLVQGSQRGYQRVPALNQIPWPELSPAI